jgi:hypothetical protein
MDQHFEAVPFQYLCADRRLFVNSEYLLQIDDTDNPDSAKGRHWYVDALVIEPGVNSVYLCEFTFSKSLEGLKRRLSAWAVFWSEIGPAITRDSGIPGIPLVRPWAFVPEDCAAKLVKIAAGLGFDGSSDLPPMKITTLEMTLPWNYRSWKRSGEAKKPDTIPLTMT